MSGETTNTGDGQNTPKADKPKKNTENMVFLWRYKEQHFSSWQMYSTFMTEAEAARLFKGKYVKFEKLTSKDLNGLDQWTEKEKS